jgi:hypothetical protein
MAQGEADKRGFSADIPEGMLGRCPTIHQPFLALEFLADGNGNHPPRQPANGKSYHGSQYRRLARLAVSDLHFQKTSVGFQLILEEGLLFLDLNLVLFENGF